MDRFVIEGGRRLDGTVRINGSKNASLPLMAVGLLNRPGGFLRGATTTSEFNTVTTGEDGTLECLTIRIIRSSCSAVNLSDICTDVSPPKPVCVQVCRPVPYEFSQAVSLLTQ